MLYIIIMVLLLAIGLFFLFRVLGGLPPGKMTATFESAVAKKTQAGSAGEVFLTPIAKLFCKFVKLNQHKREQMLSDFDRLGIQQTPEEYTGDAVARMIIFVLISLVFIPFGFPVMTVIITMLGVVYFIKSGQDISERIKKLNSEIENELPRMISTLEHSLAESKDLVRFFENYRSVSSDVLRAELNWLVFKMQTGNVQHALEQFRDRLNIPDVTQMVALLISINDGVYQHSALIRLESDIHKTQQEKLRAEILARPRKFRGVFILLIIALVALLMVGLFITIFQGLGTFS
jgi:Flp pilus assembly protein TadB